jgi:hypothetical protein
MSHRALLTFRSKCSVEMPRAALTFSRRVPRQKIYHARLEPLVKADPGKLLRV